MTSTNIFTFMIHYHVSYTESLYIPVCLVPFGTFGERRRNAWSHKDLPGLEPLRPAAVDNCLELPSVNKPAAKRGSPPCGINKTEELVKGMAKGRK